MLAKVFINVLRVFAIFELGDYLIILSDHFHRFVDNIEHNIFENAIKLIVKTINSYTAENFGRNFTIDF